MQTIKEGVFNFYARPYSVSRLTLIAITLWAITIAIIYYFVAANFIPDDIWKAMIECGIIFSVIWYILALATTRQVKIVVNTENIEVYYRNKLHYTNNVNKLIYIYGADIGSIEKGVGATTFVFENRKITFNTLDARYSTSESGKTLKEMLLYIEEKYNLEKKKREDTLFWEMCYYINSQYKKN